MPRNIRNRNLIKDALELLLNPRFLGTCIAGIFCLTVATVVGISHLFTMATALLTLPIAGYVIGVQILKRYQVDWNAQSTATQGDQFMLPIRLSSPDGALPTGIRVGCFLPRHVEVSTNAEVEASEDGTAAFWVTAKKRGYFTIGPVEISAHDPLGMFRIRRRIRRTTEVVVYPKPIKIPIIDLGSGYTDSDYPSQSGRKSRHGDFVGVREFRDGDEMKSIHWKTTARTGKLSVVQYQEPATGSVTIALDLASGTDIGTSDVTSLDIAAGAAAYAVREYLKRGKRVCLALPGKGQVSRLCLDSSSSLDSALDLLARAQANSNINVSDVVRASKDADSITVITSTINAALPNAAAEASARGTTIQVIIVKMENLDIPDQPALIAALQSSGATLTTVSEGQ